MKKELILRQQPFRSVMKIKEIKSLLGPAAISGDTFKVTGTDGKKYKLRYVDSLWEARRIEKNMKLFPKAFPRFHGREGRYLLFDWVEGKCLSREPPKEEIYQLGKLCGEVHALNHIDKKGTVDEFFNSRLEMIKGAKIVDNKTLAKIVAKFKATKKKLKIDLVLEFSDMHHHNFMINKKGKIFYVDEEGFKHTVKGLGLVKPIFRWLKKKEQQEVFWRGYNKHHSSDYFDKDYQEFVLFLQLLRTIATRIKSGGNYQQELKQLKKII